MTKLITIIFLLLSFIPALPQVSKVGSMMDSVFSALNIPEGCLEKITNAQQKTADRIQKTTERLLGKLQKQEEKIYSKLESVDTLKKSADSLLTKELYANSSAAYGRMHEKINGKLSGLQGKGGGYFPRMDSLATMLKFLKSLTDKKESLDGAMNAVGNLKGKLSAIADIQQFVSERQEMIKGLAGRLQNIPEAVKGSMGKYIGGYSKEAQLYKARVDEWKDAVRNPEKLEKAALRALNKLPAFKDFMRENGELARLFGSGSATGSNPLASLQGLQTRASVMQQLQQRLGGTGTNPQQLVRQNIQNAQSELAKLRSKAESLKNGSLGSDGNTEMPTINTQKAKPFKKRLVFDWNLQTGNRSAYSFPSSNDLGASAGFRGSDRFVFGIGVAYKFGLGTGWNKIHFSHDGIGIRSFIDWKISAPQKGVRALFSNIWLSGGYEQNHWAKFKNIPELRNAAWQASGLLGISKKIHYKKKEAKMSVLYDFLKKRLPGENPVVWRVAYNF